MIDDLLRLTILSTIIMGLVFIHVAVVLYRTGERNMRFQYLFQFFGELERDDNHSEPSKWLYKVGVSIVPFTTLLTFIFEFGSDFYPIFATLSIACVLFRIAANKVKLNPNDKQHDTYSAASNGFLVMIFICIYRYDLLTFYFVPMLMFIFVGICFIESLFLKEKKARYGLRVLSQRVLFFAFPLFIILG